MNYKILFIFMLVGSSIFARVVKDSLGREVNIPEKIERVVTGVPSNAELIIDMGLGEKLVGVDENSKEVVGLPKSVEIVGRNELDMEKIIDLIPDLVILSSHNLVYGVEKYEILKEVGIPFYVMENPKKLSDIKKSIFQLGDLLNEKESAENLEKNYSLSLKEIEDKVKKIEKRKKVYFEITYNPTYTTGKGTFINDIIEKAGGENAFENENGWISPTFESIIEKNPDVMIISSDRKNELESIKNRDEWKELEFIKKNQIFIVDEGINRPSVRSLKSLQELEKVLGSDEK